MYANFNTSIQSNWEPNSFQITWTVNGQPHYRWMLIDEGAKVGDVLEKSKGYIESQCSIPLTKADLAKLKTAITWVLAKIQG